MLRFFVIICFALGLSNVNAQSGRLFKSSIELVVEKGSTIETINIAAKNASYRELSRARRSAIKMGSSVEVINILTNEMIARKDATLSPIEQAVIKGYSEKTIYDLIKSSSKADIYAALKLAVDKGLSEKTINDLSSALSPTTTTESEPMPTTVQ